MDNNQDFNTEATYLRAMLEALPVCDLDEAVDVGLQIESFHRVDLQEVMDHIRKNWLSCQTPGSHEGAIQTDIVDRQTHLEVISSVYLWAKTAEIKKILIYRVGDNAFCFKDSKPS